jgi:hypothetical protein
MLLKKISHVIMNSMNTNGIMKIFYLKTDFNEFINVKTIIGSYTF